MFFHQNFLMSIYFSNSVVGFTKITIQLIQTTTKHQDCEHFLLGCIFSKTTQKGHSGNPVQIVAEKQVSLRVTLTPKISVEMSHKDVSFFHIKQTVLCLYVFHGIMFYSYVFLLESSIVRNNISTL